MPYRPFFRLFCSAVLDQDSSQFALGFDQFLLVHVFDPGDATGEKNNGRNPGCNHLSVLDNVVEDR
ncbi:hypothetical protein ADUPG1_005498, partial [Aduncisulcus paluster]